MSEGNPDETAARLAAIVDSSDDAIIGKDLNGTITSWNPAAERMFGYQAAEIISQSVRLIVPADRQQEEDEVLNAIREGRSVEHLETIRRRRDGVLVPVSVTVSPIRTAAGTIIGASTIAHDLDSRNRAERAARRLAAIVQSSDDAIVSKDLDGVVTSWNPAAERMFGYSAAEMIGESIRRIIPMDRQSEEDEVLGHVRRGERVEHFETLRQTKGGDLIPISLTVSPIRDRNGVIIGVSKIARDISDRKRADEERQRLLRQAQEQTAINERLNEIGTVVASALDRESIVQAVTDAATELTGAEFGAFFYNVVDPASGEGYLLYTLSGVDREEFAKFPQPRATDIFGPTFRGAATIRIADVTADPRYGKSAPYYGMPEGHLPVRSYLAVPVRARAGDVLGGLFFGHSAVGVFTEQHERLAVGIAAWASVALENARLYVGVQEASRLKDEFLATLSHELRTPLNAILGYSRMVRSGLVVGDKRDKAIETIERNATSLTQIVEDVLDVSRIISGKIRLHVQPLDLPDVVRHAVEGVMPAADARGVRVETFLDPRGGPISGDPERLQQVLWNLVTNAVKFTPRGGKVQLRVERVDSHVEVVVSDTGVGIPLDFLPHIFERFRQADAGTTRERGGLGIGLAIARHIVEMHGGTIQASSGGPGTGATFRVMLPLMIAQPQPNAGARVHPPAEQGMRTIAVPRLEGIRVLAVDDDRDALALVQEILSATEATVFTADSAAAALETIEQARPHVLVADLGMPHMDGFELIARVRRHADPDIRDVPAAALTAYARSEDRTKALRTGFQMHLTKPIDPAELMAAIASLARRARVAG